MPPIPTIDSPATASNAAHSAREATASPGRSHDEALIGLIEALLAELRPGSRPRPVRLDDSIERDLGLDSLSRVELIGRIERSFGVRLPETLAAEARTPRDLVAALHTADAAPAIDAERGRAAAAPSEVEGLPDRAASIVDAFRWHLERHPEREHVSVVVGDDPVEPLTYAGLWAAAGTIAAGLAASGVERGDRVAIMLPTSTDFFEVFLGAVRMGAVPVPLYPPFRWSQIEEHVRGRAAILGNAGASVLVTVPEAAIVGRVARAESPALRHVDSPDRLRARGAGAPVPAEQVADIALLQYTSGSTGAPKGVILTNDNLLANIRAVGQAAAATSRDRFASWLPLYHDMGLIGAWLATMFHAIPLVVMPPSRFLGRPVRWLRTIQRYGATISAAPNFAYEMAASKIPDEDLAGLDLSSWRLAFNGAEPVRAATLARFAERFAPFGFDARAMLPVYGLAECAVGLTFPPLGRAPRVDRIDRDALARDGEAVPATPSTRSTLDAVSCGSPVPGHEIRIVGERGGELPERVEGRIEFRGPSATSGYYDNPEATRRLRRNGWLDTGDVGYVADGELYVTSRVKDLIKRGGHALHPYDLEAAVGELGGVRKGCVAVFGTQDQASGTERVVVVAETREDGSDVREALRQRIAELATVHLNAPADEVLLVRPHTVLKTSSGKIRRAACRELYERGLLEAPRPRAVQQMAALLLRATRGSVHRGVRAFARAAYGLVVWGLALLIAPMALIAIVLAPRLAARHAAARTLGRVLLRAAGIRLDVSGAEHLRRGRPVVVVANHASYADAVVLTAALPIDVHWVAKLELARAPLVGFALRRLGTHFVARGDPARGAEDTRAVTAAVQAGESVGFFPEGTFTRAPGVAPFRLGAFLVSAESGAPVVPIVVVGTRSLLRAGRWLPERHPVSVSVGAPIAPEGREWASAVRLRDAARAAVVAASGEPDASR